MAMLTIGMGLTSCDEMLDNAVSPGVMPDVEDNVAVTSLTLDKATLTMKVGDAAMTLTATVAPDNATDKTLTWSSDNKAAATVADGVVTAVAAGTAIITATANDGSGVTATCTVTVLPEGTLAGVFSVSATKKVRFSKGNLQAVIASGPTDTYNYTASSWKFAENQWDYIGSAAGNTTFAVGSTVDLFGWVGTSATYNTYGLCTQNADDNACYGNSNSDALKSDWGTLAISNGGNISNSGWRTLTKDEWTYLFNTRTSGSKVDLIDDARYTMATINTDGTGVNGIILFPDGVTIAADEATTWNTINGGSDFATKCTKAQWTALADKGCVFLPAAGYRNGTSVSSANSDCNYWSSSAYESNANSAYQVLFKPSTLTPNSFGSRHSGLSVRLVRNVE